MNEPTNDSPTDPNQSEGLRKLALEVGPLLVFVVCNAQFGIFPATAALMAASVIAISVSWFVDRHVALMPMVTTVIVLISGGLTLILNDETYIKVKPTIVNTIFAIVLLVGLAMGRNFFKLLFEQAFQLTDTGWRIITYRWIGFFLFLAVLNEYIWRNYSTPFWANFKFFGNIPLTIAFGAAQLPLLKRHAPPEAGETSTAST